MSNPNPHHIAEKFIKGLTDGLSNSFVLIGKAGTGKTELVINALKDKNLQRGRHFKYISGYLSPLQLYKQLQKVNELDDPKIIVFDDCERIIQNKNSIGLLRSSLWEADGERKVHWRSSSSKVETDSFIFTGKTVFILNSLNTDNVLVKALINRGYYYNLQLDKKQMLEMIEKRAKEKEYHGLSEKERLRVAHYLKKIGRQAENLSLRSLKVGYNLYILSPNHYQELIKEVVM